ncbi:MAG: ribonucleoside reductase class II, partial [Candidatus Chisholmbacteria bacterium]|nr:ribonucleoside reductase class II [Candidatus Chisholmbacteria bacterium]
MQEPKLTETALEVVRKRYLRTDMKGRPVETPGQMLWRVARHMAKAEINWPSKELTNGEKVTYYAQAFFERMVNFKFVCAGKAMFEAGNPGGTGQLSSCFVLPIEDSIQSIFKTLGDAAVVHKNNGGTGFNFSRIRPHGDKVKNVPGAASGPVDFLKAYSAALAQILQGAKRQGANIAILNADHPDIVDFITLKDQDGTIKNFNVSVGVSDAFMEAVGKNDKWELKNPRSGEVGRVVKARELFQMITEHAWATGDPGLAFLDRLQEDNPTPALGVLDATNPCITGDALIATEYGLERFEELYKKYHNPGRVGLATDHRTITGSGVHLHHSQAFYDQGEKEVWEVETKSGFKLKATADHKIMTANGWAKLAELTPSAEVLIQSAPGVFSKDKKLPFEWNNQVIGENGRRYKFNLPIEWNQELGQLLGWLVGDGFVRLSEDEGYVVLAFGARNTQAIDYFKNLLGEYYGNSNKIGRLVPVERTRQLKLHSRFVAEWLIRLGVLPVKSSEKRVPQGVLTAPREGVRGFLQGLFGSDGTVGYVPGKSAYVRLTSKSRQLLEDVQLLLLNLGVKARIYDRSRKERKNLFPEYVSKKTGQVRQYKSDGLLWELEVSKDSVPVFLDEIGFLFGMHEEKINK